MPQALARNLHRAIPHQRARTEAISVAFAFGCRFQDAFGQYGTARPEPLARRQAGPCTIQRRPQYGDGLCIEILTSHLHGGASLSASFLRSLHDVAMTQRDLTVHSRPVTTVGRLRFWMSDRSARRSSIPYVV
jgi:hypothetical protein